MRLVRASLLEPCAPLLVSAGLEMLHQLDPHAPGSVEEDRPVRQLVGFRAVEPAKPLRRRSALSAVTTRHAGSASGLDSDVNVTPSRRELVDDLVEIDRAEAEMIDRVPRDSAQRLVVLDGEQVEDAELAVDGPRRCPCTSCARHRTPGRTSGGSLRDPARAARRDGARARRDPGRGRAWCPTDPRPRPASRGLERP